MAGARWEYWIVLAQLGSWQFKVMNGSPLAALDVQVNSTDGSDNNERNAVAGSQYGGIVGSNLCYLSVVEIG